MYFLEKKNLYRLPKVFTVSWLIHSHYVCNMLNQFKQVPVNVGKKVSNQVKPHMINHLNELSR